MDKPAYQPITRHCYSLRLVIFILSLVASQTILADNSLTTMSASEKNLPVILAGALSVLILLTYIIVTFVRSYKGKNTFFAAVLDAQSDVGEGVIVIDGKNIVYVNKAMENMLGYTASQFMSLPSICQLIAIEDHEKVIQSVQIGQNNSKVTARYEVGLINNKGYRLEGEFAISSFMHGDTNRTLIICLDISERKNTLESLRALNESLEENIQARTDELNNERQFIETMLNISGALVVLLDNEGRIIRFNNACENLTLYDFEELQQKYFWDVLIAPEKKPELKKIILDLIEKPGESTFTFEWLMRSREPRLITWYPGTFANEKDETQNIIITGIDVTEFRLAKTALVKANIDLKDTVASLKEAQNQLVQSEKMASLGSLVAGISHEINTPLGISVTSATNIEEELKQLTKSFNDGSMKRSSLEKYLNHNKQLTDILLQNIRRASELIASFKQVAVDQSSDTWRTINLREYVDEIVLSLHPKLKTHSVTVHNDFPDDLILHTNPGGLYQILSNFILNSLIHAFDDGQVGNIHLSGEVNDGQVHIYYDDDGKGVSGDNRKKIFDPFFTTRRGSGGSGLGLHIVYNLITMTFKGSIGLEEKQTSGIRFHIQFPQHSEELDYESAIHE